MSNKKISDADRSLFRKSIGEVQRIESDKINYSPPKPRYKKRLETPSAQEDKLEQFAPSMMGDKISYSQPGIPRRIITALKKGKIESEAILDLHGLTEREAKAQLAKFMQQSFREGLSSIHIIHGKGFGTKQGYPVLKNLVNRWLRQQHYVIAFCSAGHHDGGTGAVRVLIDSHP